MQTSKNAWRNLIVASLEKIAADRVGEKLSAAEITASLVLETPPSAKLGDIAFPMFAYAKAFKLAPALIAKTVVDCLLNDQGSAELGKAVAEGPYVNIFLNRQRLAAAILAAAQDHAGAFTPSQSLAGKRIMVEFSSPNTNKPLHLGHLRNDVLGESLSRILAACGAIVRKVNIINDRGIHICKSMLAYQNYGQGATPQSAGVKSDRFVGDWYVRYGQMAREDPLAEAQAQALLQRWEAGDTAVIGLWQQMNAWAVAGIKATYQRTEVSFDSYYYESETYLRGKAEILKALERGIFEREDDGSVWVDLSDEGLDRKVLLRKDGTSLYITQDIGTAIYRHEDWPFDQLVFVVGSEQQYHFKVLFRTLARLGFDWASSLYHLSYGMVNLPEGKMKSREGTVVDADELLDELATLALDEIREKDRTDLVGDAGLVAEKVGLGALHYFLLRNSPLKDMLFNPKESLSFNGDTGPYLQYMGARISSMLRKQTGSAAARGRLKPDLLTSDSEWDLVKAIAAYPEAVKAAADKLDPSLVAAYLYDLSKAFSRFYHDCPILNAPEADTATSRLELAKATLSVLRKAMHLACIPFLETM